MRREETESSSVNGSLMMVTAEQMDAAQQVLDAVNLDEVTIEKIRVKVRIYKQVGVVDDEGNPLFDDEGNPLKSREVATRTALIQNFVPLPIYNRMIAQKHLLDGADISERITIMTDLVLAVWQGSEPWMTLEKLNEGVDYTVIMHLFTLFFNVSRLSNNKA